MTLKTKTSVAKKPIAPLPTIGEYQLTQPFSTEEAGTCMWAFAERNGQIYHVKQHLSPVCPEEGCGIAPEVIARKREICKAFYKKMRRLYDAVNSSATGNIVTIENFFFYKTKFYTITEKIDSIDVSAASIARLPQEKKLLLLKVLAYSLMSLHQHGVIHGDLKITNILFKKTSNSENLLPKLIDFGDSFLVDAPNRSMVGDVYLAPESSRLIGGEEIKITPKADIFALGLLFHEFYTGSLPRFGKEFNYPFEALLDHAPLTLDRGIQPAGLATIIRSMLVLQPEERPSAEVVFKSLHELTDTGTVKAEYWKCAVCGMINDNSYTIGRFCAKCGSPKNKAPEPDEWDCVKCGYKNNSAQRDCVNCGAAKGSAVKSSVVNNKPPITDAWDCTKCGYKNTSVQRDCVNCGAVKGSVVKDEPKGIDEIFEIPDF